MIIKFEDRKNRIEKKDVLEEKRKRIMEEEYSRFFFCDNIAEQNENFYKLQEEKKDDPRYRELFAERDSLLAGLRRSHVETMNRGIPESFREACSRREQNIPLGERLWELKEQIVEMWIKECLEKAV